MVLQQARGPLIDARVCQSGVNVLPTSFTKKIAAPTTPACATKLWAKQQFVEPEDITPSLNKKTTKFIQEVSDTFLFYVWAINSTMLAALSAIVSEQAKPTENTLMKVKQFLEYVATNLEAIIKYQASNMILATHSNTSYLSEPKTTSRVSGHFFMSTNTAFPPNNGAIHITAQVIQHVISLAVEAKLGMLFIISKLATQLQKTLAKMGHPQPPTTVQRDNSTVYGIIPNKIILRASKAMTCTSTSSTAANSNSSSVFIGCQVKPITQTVGQNTILPHITNSCDKFS